MNIGHIFTEVLIYPLLNLLVFFYHYIPDIGVVIILLTVLIRLILLPSFHKSLKHQRALAALQPKMNAIKEQYKDDKEAQAKATMELYKVHKVNPFSSCLPLLIQLPILIALYRVFIQSLNGQKLVGLYSFVHAPASINPIFLHWINLSHANVYLAILAGVLQYYLSKISLPPGTNNDPASKMLAYQTMYFLPAVTIFLGIKFPGGLTLYWVVTTLFGIGQQYYILHREAKEALEKAA